MHVNIVNDQVVLYSLYTFVENIIKSTDRVSIMLSNLQKVSIMKYKTLDRNTFRHWTGLEV